MALRLSTGMVNARGGSGVDFILYAQTDITFAASTQRISSASDAFTSAKVGDFITIKGSGSNNNLTGRITAVDSGGAYIDIDQEPIDESAGASVTIVGFSRGGSFTELFKDFVIALYTGTQPTNADAAETGTLIGYVTLESGAFTPGESTNGLNVTDAVDGVCSKPSSDEWSITPIASGTIGYARFYDNSRTTGASTTAIRFDASCGVGSGDLRFSSVTAVSGVKMVCNGFTWTEPKAA